MAALDTGGLTSVSPFCLGIATLMACFEYKGCHVWKIASKFLLFGRYLLNRYFEGKGKLAP